MAKNKYTQVGNIFTGADASNAGAANANRASAGAARRAGVVGNAMLEAVMPVLMQDEVFNSLPRHIQDGLRSGDPQAAIEGAMYIGRSGRIPQNIPRDQALQPFPGPGGEAGFQMGANGGRVRTDSAGELIQDGPRGLVRNPGAEAGFQMGGGVPPQNFDPTGLSVPGPGSIVARPQGSGVRFQQRNSPRGVNPLMAGGAMASAGLGGYAAGNAAGGPMVNYIADFLGDPVDVVPESRTDGAPDVQIQRKRVSPATNTMHSARAARVAAGRQGGPPSVGNGPGDPLTRTYNTLLDAGIEPARAAAIAQNKASMTQMEYDAVIGNGDARRQRMQDQIEIRRAGRMGGY